MKSVVSEKGQITIPKRLRDEFGLRAGQMLDFQVEGGRLVASKIIPRDPVDSVYGVLDLPPTDDLLTDLRGGQRSHRQAPRIDPVPLL